MIYRRIRSFTCESGFQKKNDATQIFWNILWMFFLLFQIFWLWSEFVCFLFFWGGGGDPTKTLRWRGDVLPLMAFKIWNTKAGLAWLHCHQPRMEQLSNPQVITPPTCSYIVISCLTSIKQISLKHRTKEVLLVIMHGDRIKGVWLDVSWFCWRVTSASVGGWSLVMQWNCPLIT